MSGASGNVRAGRAFVELMLDQTKLERGLKAAQAKLRNFGNSMTSVGKNLVTVATLAAAPLAYSTKKSGQMPTLTRFYPNLRPYYSITFLQMQGNFRENSPFLKGLRGF